MDRHCGTLGIYEHCGGHQGKADLKAGALCLDGGVRGGGCNCVCARVELVSSLISQTTCDFL